MAVIRKCNLQKFHNHIVTKTTTKMIILMTDLGLIKGMLIKYKKKRELNAKERIVYSFVTIHNDYIFL